MAPAARDAKAGERAIAILAGAFALCLFAWVASPAAERQGGNRPNDTMTGPIIAIDTSEILEGKRAEVERAVGELVAFVDQNVPRVIAYQVFLDPEGKTMTVLQIHPDSASMEQHLTAAAPVFRQFEGLIRLSTLDVYGEPSDELLSKLRDKARMLGGPSPAVHEAFAGFSRLERR